MELIDRLVDAWTPASDDERDLVSGVLKAGVRWNATVSTTLTSPRRWPRCVHSFPKDFKGLRIRGCPAGWRLVPAGVVQPLTVEAFDERVREAPDEAVQFVLSFEERTFPSSGETTREEAAQMLRRHGARTVQGRPWISGPT